MCETNDFGSISKAGIEKIDNIITEKGDLEALTTEILDKINENSPYKFGKDLWDTYKQNPQATDAVLITLAGCSMASLLIFSGLIEGDEL